MQPNAGAINFIPLIFIFFVFYFLIIRPQQKKQKEHREVIKNLKKNDEVVTNGGIHGTIINVKEKTFILRLDENLKIEIDKGSIAYAKKLR
ncbi:MAG: preprotein translocase subunit YajC [Omnitrophica bacterium]|nr:preprotein translocase subunit YajC [Candidatus Omnitrophota bacterium]